MNDSVQVGKLEPWANGNEYLLSLGKLIGHYHSLEFALRAYLQAQPNARPLKLDQGVTPYDFSVGDSVPESEMTSFDSLGQLIKNVNVTLKCKGLQEIDPDIVRVRDALAHGRVSSSSVDSDMRLVKFSKAKSGSVTIEFNEKLDRNWFKKRHNAVYEAIMLVVSQLPPPHQCNLKGIVTACFASVSNR